MRYVQCEYIQYIFSLKDDSTWLWQNAIVVPTQGMQVTCVVIIYMLFVTKAEWWSMIKFHIGLKFLSTQKKKKALVFLFAFLDVRIPNSKIWRKKKDEKLKQKKSGIVGS